MWNFLSSVGDSVSTGARAMTDSLGITQPDVRKILFVGIDNAGKTTLCYRLTDPARARFSSALPATRFCEMHQVNLGGHDLKIIELDVGGQTDVYRLYRDYLECADAVFFFVDASSPHRFEEAKYELDHLLMAEKLKNIPIVILGNKIDLPSAVSEEELKRALGLDKKEILTGKHHAPRDKTQRPCELFMMSVLRPVGYEDTFRWLFAIWGIEKEFPEPRLGCWEYRKRVLLCAFRGKSRLSRVMHEEYVVLRLTTKFC